MRRRSDSLKANLSQAQQRGTTDGQTDGQLRAV